MTDNKSLVLAAFDTLFNKRDYAAAERFWSPDYVQHSAHIPPGREGLFDLVRAAPPELRYENAVAVADGEYVVLHGRFTGSGRSRAWIAGDIVRIENGVLAEHWDVLQDEVTKEESKSGLPMFGDRFPSAPPNLTVEKAREIVAPLYEALNRPREKDVPALLSRACHEDYRSYSTNEEWLSRDALADVFEQIGAIVPDLAWSVVDVMVSGDRVIVRGEATGTPVADLFGARPTGESFKTMAIDLFTVRGEKLASAYHVENWVGAIQQVQRSATREADAANHRTEDVVRSNKEVVLEVLRRAFIDRDPTVVEQLFGTQYKQHNPALPDGPSAIAKLIPTLTALTYEPGMATAERDLVMVHGRYTGWGPKPMVAVDIFRVDDGKVVEHWDVMQEEVPVADTASGNAMFSTPTRAR
jgi:predicted SnoaL-like aldol condensation-catalyzing enzyme